MIPSLPSNVWISIVVTIISCAIGLGVRYIVPTLQDDNLIEEGCEEVIEYQTGFDIDLTPQSSEKKKE